MAAVATTLLVVGSGAMALARAADAPAWMHAQLAAPLPPHDAKATAVVLYSETILTVQPNGRMKRLDRQAIKILRPDGEARGVVRADFDSQSRITGLRAWCIPAVGKDYEVRERDAVESAVGVDGGELVTDVRAKTLRIPASTVGSVVGYELEQEVRPYVLMDEWGFQDTIPVREAHFALQLPRGWTYRTLWLNHDEAMPTETAPGQWNWSLAQLPAIRLEPRMPPWRGISGRMLVAVVPPNGQDPGIQSWRDLGAWYLNLTQGRREASPDIKRKVAELTMNETSLMGKIQALARFVQTDIRYVAIELGIGGFQPHAAAEVFSHHYGDCKDKVTLLSTMLKEIGVESHYVLVNTTRGSVTAGTPPNLDFDHAILAVVLPAGIDTASLQARVEIGKLGPILFFDPTDEFTAFGELSGPLQANYGMLVTADGSDLVELPQLPTDTNGIDRTATLVLDGKGTLRGEVHEVRRGDQAAAERYALRATTQDIDRVKPLESAVGASLATFQILKATVANLRVANRPFEWNFTLEAENYGKPAGDLMLVRPRALGILTSDLMESKEPRVFPVEFPGPEHDTDVVEITLPAGYEVDGTPPPVDVDDGFASYHSKTEVVGRVLRYSRRFEIKELTVPAAKAALLRDLFRIIASDERNTAVLKPVAH